MGGPGAVAGEDGKDAGAVAGAEAGDFEECVRFGGAVGRDFVSDFVR